MSRPNARWKDLAVVLYVVWEGLGLVLSLLALLLLFAVVG